jgi:hypothetical protein
VSQPREATLKTLKVATGVKEKKFFCGRRVVRDQSRNLFFELAGAEAAG